MQHLTALVKTSTFQSQKAERQAWRERVLNLWVAHGHDRETMAGLSRGSTLPLAPPPGQESSSALARLSRTRRR